MTTIADFPAYRIFKAYEGRKFKHNEVIAIPFNSRSHGVLYSFFTLGTVAGYAIERGECPIAEVARVEKHNAENPRDLHKMYWANKNSVTLSNRQERKREVPGFEFGDRITLQGHDFILTPDHNDNCKLVAIED